jgi:RNA polymerase sigma factor (sigma-70 family)
VAPCLVAVSPWTTWLPLTGAAPPVGLRPAEGTDAEAEFLGGWLRDVFTDLGPAERVVRELGFDWKHTPPADLWRQAVASPDPTVAKLAAQAQAMYRFADKQGDLPTAGRWDLGGVARSLNLPRASVTSAAIRLAQALAARRPEAEAEPEGAAEESAWPPVNGPRFIRGERFGRMLLEVTERLATRYPGRDFTDGAAVVFNWFDGRLRRNRRFINGRRFPTEDAFRAYLRQAVWNASRMAARSRRRGEPVQALPAERKLASSDPTPAQLASLHEAVEKLPQPQRTILEKLFFEQEDIGRIAEALQLPRAEVERLYEEAIDRLPL